MEFDFEHFRAATKWKKHVFHLVFCIFLLNKDALFLQINTMNRGPKDSWIEPHVESAKGAKMCQNRGQL